MYPVPITPSSVQEVVFPTSATHRVSLDSQQLFLVRIALVPTSVLLTTGTACRCGWFPSKLITALEHRSTAHHSTEMLMMLDEAQCCSRRFVRWQVGEMRDDTSSHFDVWAVDI